MDYPREMSWFSTSKIRDIWKKISSLKFSLSPSIIGIDIGSKSIKALQVEERKEEVYLKSLGVAYFSKGLKRDLDEDEQSANEIRDLIEELLSNLSPTTKKVALSVRGKNVIVKRVSVPIMPEDEMSSFIKAEISNFLPFESSLDVNLDFYIIGENPQKKDEVEILLAAARKRVINSFTMLLEDIGFEVVLLDVASLALANTFEFFSEKNLSCVICDFGASSVEFVALKDGVPLFVREITYGASRISDSLQKELSIGEREAEALLRGKKIGDIDYEKVDEIINSGCERICNEVARSSGFLSTNYPDVSVEKIFACGGYCDIYRLKNMIEERLELPFEIMDPLKKVKFNKDLIDPEYVMKVSPLMGVALGLSLRGATL